MACSSSSRRESFQVVSRFLSPSRSDPLFLLPFQIFLSTRIVGLPHVQLEDRYEIVKVRSLEGYVFDPLPAVLLPTTRAMRVETSKTDATLPLFSSSSPLSFYGITVRLGYRDPKPSYVEEIVPRLRAIEAAYDLKRAGANIKELDDAARNSTHMFVRSSSLPLSLLELTC